MQALDTTKPDMRQLCAAHALLHDIVTHGTTFRIIYLPSEGLMSVLISGMLKAIPYQKNPAHVYPWWRNIYTKKLKGIIHVSL